jgi:N-acetylneuraminic acid mutarotase
MKNALSTFSILVATIVATCSLSSNCAAQWTKEANYPGGVTDEAVAFTIGDTVYIGGGSSGSQSFYKFDPSSGKWTRKKDISQRADGVSFSIGSKGYVALGEADPSNLGPASVTNDLWQYDPTIDKWTQMANFPAEPREASVAFVIDSLAYVCGGIDTAYVYSDMYSYDPSTDTWNALSGLPDYFNSNSSFVIGNYGYVAVGVEDTNEVSHLWQYDPSSDNWTQLSDFPGLPRESAVAFALDSMGYVGLGQSGDSIVFTDFYSYDPTQDQWTQADSYPNANGRGWASAVSTTSAAFVGLGTYFLDTSYASTDDFWRFLPVSSVADAPVSNNIEVYPNPTTGFVNIEITNSVISSSVQVRNEIGALCLRSQINSEGRLDLSSLPAGIYNIEITSGDYHANERVVKE